MRTCRRHLAWFDTATGGWLGEWDGALPVPVVPATLTGDARMQVMNAWLQRVQGAITPSGSPYVVEAQAWDLAAWDACADGAAVCLDVSLYGWPVGDFRWACFDQVDGLVDFREWRVYLEVQRQTARLDVNLRSPRQVSSTPERVIVDVTGTPLAPHVGRLFGRFERRDGRIMFLPDHGGSLPPMIVAEAGLLPDVARVAAHMKETAWP